MPVKYKYDDAYKKYQSFSLRKEFELLRDYLLLDENHANDEAFAAADEIYHWFCIKSKEVAELRGIHPTFAETGEIVHPGNIAYSLRGPMEVKSIEIDRGGWTLWGERDGERYIIDQGEPDSTATATEERALEFMEVDDA